MIEWIYVWQTRLHQLLLTQVDLLKDGLSFDLVLVLLGMCFAYGLFHAAGPGHGKLVLGSYALGSRALPGRLVWLSLASSMTQGLTAIALIGVLVVIGGMLPRETESSVDWAERLSFVALGGVGLWLLIQAARQWISGERQCSHNHSRMADAGIVTSVALRPCSGAILVLVLCQSLGRFWLGAGGVVVMSVGTALGVLLVTLASITGRNLLWKASGIHHKMVNHLLALIRALLGLLLLYIAWLLLTASFAPRHPLAL